MQLYTISGHTRTVVYILKCYQLSSLTLSRRQTNAAYIPVLLINSVQLLEEKMILRIVLTEDESNRE